MIRQHNEVFFLLFPACCRLLKCLFKLLVARCRLCADMQQTGMCTVSYLKCENDGRTSEALLDSVQTTGSSAVGFQSESGADGLPTAAPSRRACLSTRNSEFSFYWPRWYQSMFRCSSPVFDFVSHFWCRKKKKIQTAIFIVTSALWQKLISVNIAQLCSCNKLVLLLHNRRNVYTVRMKSNSSWFV